MKTISTQAEAKQNIYKDYYDVGRAFEKFIIGLFNQRNFHLKSYNEARKRFDYSDNLSNPDLEMELVFTGTKKYRFAVECKWRKEFKEGKIEWANSFQICSYEEFQITRNMPVFIAIGIGGEPSNPEKLFVTPLDYISRYIEVYESELIPFKRKPTHKFFYDYRQLTLF